MRILKRIKQEYDTQIKDPIVWIYIGVFVGISMTIIGAMLLIKILY